MRPRPCSPGGYERRSIAQFSVRQRSPFRKSFIPSRRQMRHFGPRSLASSGYLRAARARWAPKSKRCKDAGSVRSRRLRARPRTRQRAALQASSECEMRARWPPSDAPPLPRANTVVRLRRDVLDAEDLEACRLQRTDRRLAARARALHEDLDLLKAVLHSLPRARVGGDLRCKRRGLARALEPGRAGGLPRDHVALLVGERDDRVVEARLDVRLADRDVLLRLAPRATARGGLSPRRRHVTSPSTCRDRRSSSGPCGSVRSSSSAARASAGRAGVGGRDTRRSRTAA